MRKVFNLRDMQEDFAKRGELLSEDCFETKCESKIAQELQKDGIKLLAQHKIKDWSFDFKLFDYPILIEVDGGVHNFMDKRFKDYIKDRYAQGLGFKVLRYSNFEIKHRLPFVVKEIKIVMKNTKKQPKIIYIHKTTFLENIKEFFGNILKKFK